MSAEMIHSLAAQLMSPNDFAQFLAKNGLTQEAAAAQSLSQAEAGDKLPLTQRLDPFHASCFGLAAGSTRIVALRRYCNK